VEPQQPLDPVAGAQQPAPAVSPCVTRSAAAPYRSFTVALISAASLMARLR
jgi:hypothetical protein